MLRLKKSIIAIFIPLVASSTLIATGFSLWGFLNDEYPIDERIYSQSVDVKPYYDSLGTITYSWDDDLYQDLRIVFEEGNEQQVTSNEEGITFMPSLHLNFKDVPYVTNTEITFSISTNIVNVDGCPFDYSDYLDPQGFRIGEEETILENLVLSYEQIMETQSDSGLNLDITPIYHWIDGSKPLDSASYGDFINNCENCTCSISVSLNLSISNIGGNN